MEGLGLYIIGIIVAAAVVLIIMIGDPQDNEQNK